MGVAMGIFDRRALCAAAASAVLASPALAQTDTTPTVSELVVTAQLRVQRPVEVPFALTAFSGADLEGLGIQEFEELSAFVPGFEVQNQSPNNPGFVMRGITSDSGEATNEPRVSVFQDGVSVSKSRGSYIELFDIKRVEIAKGPQSTLYGRGALIGGVNVIQNKARPGAFTANGRIEAGDFGYGLAEGALNVPIGETAAVRLAARIKKRDGYVENLLGGADFNSTNTWAARGAFNLTPSDVLRFDLIANFQKDSPAGSSVKSAAYSPTSPATGAVLGPRAPWDGAALANGGVEGGRALGLEREVWGVTGLAHAAFGPSLTLDSVTAYRRFTSLEVFDPDGISLPLLSAAEHAAGLQASQELRLSYRPEGRVSGLVGASYFHEDGFQRTPAQFDERMTLARLAGALSGGGALPGRPATDPAPSSLFASTTFTGSLLRGLAAASGVTISAPLSQAIAANLKAAHQETGTNSSETGAIDLFGQLDFQPTDQLELGLGVRYLQDDKTSGYRSQVTNGRSILGGFIAALSQPLAARTQLLTALAVPGAANIPTSPAYPVQLFGLAMQPTANNGDRVTADLEDKGFTWRATARYAVSEDTSLYANYARGRRPGVLSARPPTTPGGAPRFAQLPAESVDSLEIGAKTISAGRFALDAAVFGYHYKNFQTTEQVGVLVFATNAGEAKAYGFETQGRLEATDNLTLHATYAFNHSRFETGLRDGNRFRLSPDHTVSLGATLRGQAFGGEIAFRPTYTWQSEVFFDDDNDLPALQQPPGALVADNLQDERQDAYGLLNLRLDFTTADGRWGVGAFVTNALGETHLKDAGNVGDAIGLPTFIAGEPRFVGVTLTVRN